MSDFTEPLSVKDFKAKIWDILDDIVEEYIGANGVIETPFNVAMDEAAGNYRDKIEDGVSHRKANSEAMDGLRDELFEIVDSMTSDLNDKLKTFLEQAVK